MRHFTTGLVLAAGVSSRLGRPKQLLDFHGRSPLDATLDMARRCDVVDTWADYERLLESS